DRVTLSNLVVNPGFEAGSGAGVQVFSDSFATHNAYTVLTGTTPSVASNVLSVPASTQLRFGSSVWGPVNQWQLRFSLVTAGQSCYFYLHFLDNNNHLRVDVNPTALDLNHVVGGTLHTLGSVAVTITAGTYYWLTFTQFPTTPGTPADVQITLNADSGGTLGAVLASIAQVPTFDGVTALSGSSVIEAGGTVLHVSSNTVALFGPGGWLCFSTDGTTGPAAGSWDQSTANTYTGGAVTSFGSARIDAAPAGTLGGNWETWAGGPTAGTSAIPAAPAQTFGVSAWVRSSGVGASCAHMLQVIEYDTNGALLRSGTVVSKTGPQAAWTQLSGTYTTGASCAWLGLRLEALDSTTGSVGGTVWFDNAQCWNETTTGASSMPYCELRFPQSPAQLLVTGLLGDLPAPASLAWGTYLSTWNTGSTLGFALGRRAKASANAKMAAPSQGYYGPGVSPQATAYLDASAYGGYYAQALANPQWNPRAFSFPPADLLGVFHLFSRFFTSQSAPNLGNLETRVVTQQKTSAWFGNTSNADQVGAYNGPFTFPISAASTWTVCDSGQVNVPALPSGALTDLTATSLTPRSQWGDTTAGGSTCRSDWQLLLPVDGSLLVGVINNPSNAPFNVTSSWLWVYHDGLLLNRSAVGDTAATTYSVESLPTANPANGGGGPGTSSTGVINVNNGADPALTLDPSVAVAATSSAAGGNGVNQMAGYVADNAGAVLPLHAEIQYSPLYLYPR
ncbi:MAG TPA: hypothetical protein VFN78_11750, partial [Ktedonobacterales bacterium]|nr:hypothetical protein [Ktedonobacterales bacterium]